VSEEDAQHQPPAAGKSYFLVDPLDGTREFISGHDDYTTNIAFLTGGAPLVGVISAPALGLIWRGIVGRGAERLAFADDGKTSPPTAIRVRPARGDETIVLVSRSHLDARTKAYVEAVPRRRTVPCGSSIKFCRIAEGSADLYPRLAPTHDWDIAAGHAILAAAGGRVRAPDGSVVIYGTSELLVPAFIAFGSDRASVRD
jgi:3'(2'), 5'-bisphosphate nucleotidase